MLSPSSCRDTRLPLSANTSASSARPCEREISPFWPRLIVHTPDDLKWRAIGWEAGKLGYPVDDELTNPDGQGKRQQFEGGTVADLGIARPRDCNAACRRLPPHRVPGTVVDVVPGVALDLQRGAQCPRWSRPVP
ncbi:hypothetical protein [Streptomyces sp. MUSC 14]|uniref:LGFP repeat-containing protein n=1 Tax=Streptomyces sp. MUSC 14 TaxID=1354889 RepID=UPI000D1BA5E3